MKNEIYIKTMAKSTFDKLSSAKKRIAVAQDVIDRMNLKQFRANSGQMFKNANMLYPGQSVQEALKDPAAYCEVCAKGGLFMAYVGIKNDYNLRYEISENLNGEEMEMLSDVFSRKQLSLIETAFEGSTYSWNDDISHLEKQACFKFYRKHVNEKEDRDGDKVQERLMAICKNIIKNNGTFKP